MLNRCSEHEMKDANFLGLPGFSNMAIRPFIVGALDSDANMDEEAIVATHPRVEQKLIWS